MEYLEALARWQTLSESIKALQAEEKALREGLFFGTFREPKEGVNSYQLPDGRVVKGTYKLTRTLDEDKLADVAKEAGLTKSQIPTRTKIELDLKKYRLLPEEKRVIFDHCITVKPGLPSLEVVVPEVSTPVTPLS